MRTRMMEAMSTRRHSVDGSSVQRMRDSFRLKRISLTMSRNTVIQVRKISFATGTIAIAIKNHSKPYICLRFICAGILATSRTGARYLCQMVNNAAKLIAGWRISRPTNDLIAARGPIHANMRVAPRRSATPPIGPNTRIGPIRIRNHIVVGRRPSARRPTLIQVRLGNISRQFMARTIMLAKS